MKILVTVLGTILIGVTVAILITIARKSVEQPSPTVSPTTGISCAVVHEP